MEKEEKNKNGFNESEACEPLQQDANQENQSLESTEEQPEKKPVVGRVVFFLIFAAIVAVSAMLIIKWCHNKNEYGYEYGEEPSDGHVAHNNGTISIVNPDTKEVIVKDIDWSHYSSSTEEPPIVLFAKNGKRGFCNIATGKVIVEPTTYTKAWIFSEGLAAVEKDGFIGFVDANGNLAINFKFSYRGNPLTEFVFHNGHCVVADSSNKIGVIDKKGRWLIKPSYDNIELAKDYAIVYTDGDFKKQIDFNGNVLQDGIIDDINDLYYDVKYTNAQTGEPNVGSAKNNDYYEYRVGSYSGLIDSQGNIITPPIYTDISCLTPTLFKARLQDWISIVIIDNKGNVLSKS
ncbi:MAG: WG repeat-containing protein [Bacteroidales bacterium]|nr:WG repeat-containing protein [Bacteroidales bacterium]